MVEEKRIMKLLMKKHQILLVFLASLLISSCATVSEKHIDSVSFITKDMGTGEQIKGAKCEIAKNNKVISSGFTPFTIDLNSRQKDISISCVLKKYKIAKTALPRITTEGFDTTMSNSVSFLGAGIDLLSNSNKKYPNLVTMIMEKQND